MERRTVVFIWVVIAVVVAYVVWDFTIALIWARPAPTIPALTPPRAAKKWSIRILVVILLVAAFIAAYGSAYLVGYFEAR